ncbi:MAG: serine/threonine-protein kinase [Polyangiaceae bacterium]
MLDDATTQRTEGPDEAGAIEWEHSARTRIGLWLTAVGGAVCAGLLQLVRHKTAMHWVITSMLVLLVLVCGPLAYWARKPERTVPPKMRFGIGILIALTALAATAFLGVISSTALVLSTIVYAYAMTDWKLEAWTTYAVCAVGYLVIAGLSFFGVLPLTESVLALKKENTRALVGLTLLAEMTFAQTFWFSWRGRRATVAAMQRVAEARLEAERRAALLAEAREDLRQVVDAGRLGRLSGLSLDGFDVGDVIGRGAMGEVYSARRASDGAPVALKVLHPHLIDSEEDVERFQREVRFTTAIQSPHVVEVLGTGTAPDGSPYLVMEWLTGSDLATLLRDEGRLELPETIELVKQVAEALERARASGIVHRDVKPQNLFRVESTQGHSWKVLDFGVSRFVDRTSTLTQGVVGTPSYMAPEQCRGLPLDHRADVFALSLVAYRALTGRPVFSAADQYTVIYRIVHEQPVCPSDLAMLPADVDLCLALGLAKEREERFASAGELAEALAQASHNALAPELRTRARALLHAHPWALPE